MNDGGVALTYSQPGFEEIAMSDNSKARLTIETLENMFVYLGCANIPTQDAMDGAIPLESLMDACKDGIATAFTPSEMEKLGPQWSSKAVWFSGEHLGLTTIENIHWSVMSRALSNQLAIEKMLGNSGPRSLTDDAHGFIKLYYSEIDRFGKFVKFPVGSRHFGGFSVKQIYNPEFVFGFRNDEMLCLRCDSNRAYKEKGLTFLAPFMCGVAQSIGSYWLVRTRFDEICPALTLLTDPTGVKEFWKLRDVPAGKSRRAALLHWVENHWRQCRRDDDVEVYVRKHMRGATALSHGKFSAEITPSKCDSVADEAARQDRILMKKLRTDRRRKRRATLSRK